ncbi:methyltransferase [Nocardioides bizhenqiangii]|uniref:Methyltransferase domain-containing protein n=1 Tax=Nocardioides bizhenqiangii TaxID=3095076 RepID=A0ABZ0ZM95_9ACTN|nr:methyltransferase [Nocardioides sp. HM61]WQQ24886.1 methyltransferase domain-containing protein [Nocardioides sp. HM61]
MTSLEAGREALARGDHDEARRLLMPLVEETPAGPATIVLARVELAAARPDVALTVLDAFLGERPHHGGATLLRARAKLATGDFRGARIDAETAAALLPDPAAAGRVLTRIDKVRAGRSDTDVLAEARPLLAVVDAGYLEARRSGPTDVLRRAARELSAMDPGGDWTADPERAKVAYFSNATDPDEALRSYDAHLIEVSAEFGYITWPRRIQEHVRGRSVIDVGCGFGGFGMGFLVAGATSYLGLDPAMDLETSDAKNKRIRSWSDMGVTPREIAETLPAIRLVRGKSEDLSFDETFDTISLHNVTEHLQELDRVFAGLVPLCKPDTKLVFHHHNFYCWNGHHDAPNQPEQLDESLWIHRQIADWRHIDLVPSLPPYHQYLTDLNRIRLDELRAITERYFEVERWEEIPSSPSTIARLTPEILDRVRQTVPDLTERDLSVNVVLAVASPKTDHDG